MQDLQVNPPPSSVVKNQGPGQRKKGGIAVVLALLLGSSGIFVWLASQRSANNPEGATAESTLPLETFVINLTNANLNGAPPTGSSQRAYLRVGITLGLAHPLPRNQAETPPTALVRDTILSVLAGAQPNELLKAEGKRQLKGELLKAMQERVPQLAVENVYFTEFLVQM
jgi:flagellar basal body-associated protein FliL